jgi:hypothetical protein
MNRQLGKPPTLVTISSETTISDAVSLSIFATGGSATITGAGSIALPSGSAIEFQADTGNTLGDITIAPAVGASVLVAFFR